MPAQPSTTGVADVFAFQADGTVQAITSDGTTAWIADVSNAFRAPEGALPDFQGGLVLAGQSSIWKLDGITGQPYPAYAVDPYPALTELTNAQWALGLAGTDLSANTGSPSFAKVLWSTGEGIGNTAAHEIGHQFLGNSLACGMNDDTSKVGV